MLVCIRKDLYTDVNAYICVDMYIYIYVYILSLLKPPIYLEIYIQRPDKIIKSIFNSQEEKYDIF
jgi:hypothetical protein